MHGLEAETEWIWRSGIWKRMNCFDQKVSNFDDVEKIQLSRRSQKSREETCSKVRLQIAEEKSWLNAGGAMLGIMERSIPSACTILGQRRLDYCYPYRRRKYQISLKREEEFEEWKGGRRAFYQSASRWCGRERTSLWLWTLGRLVRW